MRVTKEWDKKLFSESILQDEVQENFFLIMSQLTCLPEILSSTI